MRSPKTKPDWHRSLFGDILDWMLAPLLFVWPISIAVTHYFANVVAAYPYDQALREQVAAIARQIKIENGRVSVVLPASARAILRADEVDQVYFRVMRRYGEYLAGDQDLPLAEDIQSQPDEPGETYFRNAEVGGQDLRIAYQYMGDPSLTRDRWVLVEVGETLEKRRKLTNQIIASVILPQFVIIPMAVVLVWFGLSQGLKPLLRLRRKIEARKPGDVSEIPATGVPDELVPLILAFNALIARTRKSMQTQQRFIADAAHQLRTPLAGLKTQAQLALRETDPAALHDALVNVAAGVDRSNRLVGQMLALVRADALDRQSFVPVDLDAMVRQLAEDWVGRAMDRQIDFGFESGGKALTLGSEFLLHELISNLIDNALRYTPPGGHVTARVLLVDDIAAVEVEDNGIGVSESDAELVFEPFFRVDNSHSEGSGLGLAIVRQIAALHRADVSLRPNSKERGTVARVEFALYREGQSDDDTSAVSI